VWDWVNRLLPTFVAAGSQQADVDENRHQTILDFGIFDS
jgi:hypothetical protein